MPPTHSLNDPPSTTTPVTLFYSYAHEDESLRNELAGHLKILERRGLIKPWHDRQIVPGQNWNQGIDKYLGEAELVLLLLSVDFINSDYIFGVELKSAMRRQAQALCEVVPILVRPVDVDPDDADDLPFMKLQALPPDLKAVTTWANRDEAWTQVAKGLRATVKAIHARRPVPVVLAVVEDTPPAAPAARSAQPAAPSPTAPAPNPRPDMASDPMLAQVVHRFTDELNAAQQQRGGPPLFDHHIYEVQQGSLALIDLSDQQRVLWVDDRPDNNRRERAALAQLQIEVVCVTSSALAMDRIAADARQGEAFNLVISDWSRPIEGRNAALQLLAALQQAGQHLPVVVYHGEFDADTRARRTQRVLDAGGFGEAVLPAELLQLVQKALLR